MRCWRMYVGFSLARSPSFPVPPDPRILADFFASLSAHPPLARAIYRVVAALKHGFACHDVDWSPSPATALLIRGIAKSAAPATPLTRAPFLPSDLLALLSSLDLSHFANLHLTTAAALALYLALRPAELSALQRACLARNPDATYSISFSRVKARLTPRLESRRLASTTLLRLLDTYLARAPPRSDGRLFDLPDSTAVNTLALQISTMLSTSSFRGHSFRIGSATALCLLGYPALEIKSWGDWRSDSYLRYIRNARSHVLTSDPLSFFPPYTHH